MAVGHQITRAFPTAYVSSWNCPSRTSQVAFACEKFKIDRRPEKDISVHPVLDLSEFVDSHRAGEEEILWPEIQPLDHVSLGSVVLVPGSDRVSVDAQIRKIIEHLFDLLHIGLFVDGGVRRDLVPERLRHFDGE